MAALGIFGAFALGACGPAGDVAGYSEEADVIERDGLLLLGGEGLSSLEDVKVGRGGDLFVLGRSGARDLSIGGVPAPREASAEVFVARLTPSYELVWAHSFSGSGHESAERLALGEDGDLVVSGSFDGDLDLAGVTLEGGKGRRGFLAKLRADDGALVWGAELPLHHGAAGSRQGVFRVGPALGPDGSVFTTETDRYGETLRVEKRDGATGEVLWRRDLFSTGFGVGGLAVDRDGALVVAGAVQPEGELPPVHASVDFGDGETRSDHGFLFAIRLGGEDGAIGASRTWVPEKEKGTDLTTRIDDVLVGEDGAIYLGGLLDEPVSFGGERLAPREGFDALIVRLESDLSFSWAKALGGAGNQVAKRLASGASGEILVHGDGDGDAGDELFLLALSAERGELLFEERLQAEGSARGLAAAEKGVYFTASVFGDFGGETIPMTGLLGLARP